MKTLFRYLAITLGALLSLLLILTLAVVLFVDPNDYRDDILNALSEETGRKFSLEGDIELGAFPCCSLQLGPISAGNPVSWTEQRWQDADFLRVENAELSVQLWPLLTKQELRVGQVRLDGLVLNLVSRRDGSVNWEFDSAQSESDESADESGNESFALNVDGIDVRGAQVRYSDLATGDLIELNDVNFSSGRIEFDEPADIRLSLSASGLLPDQAVQVDLRAAAVISADGNQAELRDLSLQLDDSELSGWLKAVDLNSQRLAFDLQIDRLNADAYITGDAAEGAATPAGDPNTDRIDIPQETLRDLNLDGTLKIAELIFDGALLNDVTITVAAKGGMLRMHPLTAQLYDGSYAGDVRLDVRGSKPKLAIDEKLTGITVESLLADTSDITNLAGQGNVRITASSRGDTVGELLEKLNGDAAFDLQEGLYKGVDLWYEIRKARALLKKEPAPAKPEQPQTELSEFSGTLNFAGGVATNRDFKAALPRMKLTGSGSINLLASTMDYRLQARVVDTPKPATATAEAPQAGVAEGAVEAEAEGAAEVASGTKVLQELKGLTLPISIKGSLSDPTVRIDLGSLLKDNAKTVVKEKVRERLQDKLKDKFKLFD